MRKNLITTNRRLDYLAEKQHKEALKRARISRLIQKKRRFADEDEQIRPEHDQLVLQEEEEAERAHAALHADKWSLERAMLLFGHDADPEERQELEARLTPALRKAASQLHTAHLILNQAASDLHLGPRIVQDATHILCQYAAQKDGLSVRGVSSRLACDSESQEASDKLREYNAQKQMASIASALLYLEARKHGHARSLQEVVSTFQGPNCQKEGFVKTKHCSKAINELRSMFPDYMRSVAPGHQQPDADGNFVEHLTRKLMLPPVATASVQILVQHLAKEQSGSAGVKLSAIAASATFLVTMAGEIMQRLARQAEAFYQTPSSKRAKLGDTNDVDDDGRKNAHFDLFSHPAVDDQSHRTYEMRQMWDAWTEQMPWGRAIGDIEQSCSVSRSAIMDYYKNMLYPRRVELLTLLRNDPDDKLKSTPRAPVLLSNLPAASPLLTSNMKL
jgi:hypothetical protein